jgi:hypothetical protein
MPVGNSLPLNTTSALKLASFKYTSFTALANESGIDTKQQLMAIVITLANSTKSLLVLNEKAIVQQPVVALAIHYIVYVTMINIGAQKELVQSLG